MGRYLSIYSRSAGRVHRNGFSCCVLCRVEPARTSSGKQGYTVYGGCGLDGGEMNEDGENGETRSAILPLALF